MYKYFKKKRKNSCVNRYSLKNYVRKNNIYQNFLHHQIHIPTTKYYAVPQIIYIILHNNNNLIPNIILYYNNILHNLENGRHLPLAALAFTSTHSIPATFWKGTGRISGGALTFTVAPWVQIRRLPYRC